MHRGLRNAQQYNHIVEKWPGDQLIRAGLLTETSTWHTQPAFIMHTS